MTNASYHIRDEAALKEATAGIVQYSAGGRAAFSALQCAQPCSRVIALSVS